MRPDKYELNMCTWTGTTCYSFHEKILHRFPHFTYEGLGHFCVNLSCSLIIRAWNHVTMSSVSELSSISGHILWCRLSPSFSSAFQALQTMRRNRNRYTDFTWRCFSIIKYHKRRFPRKHLIDSLNIIYTIREEQHKCKVTKRIPRQNNKTLHI